MKKIGIAVLMILVILGVSACEKEDTQSYERPPAKYEISDTTASLQADLDNAELIIHVPEGFDVSAGKYSVMCEEYFDNGSNGIYIRVSGPRRGRAKGARNTIESQWQSIYSNVDFYEIQSLESGKFTNSYGKTVYYSDFWYKSKSLGNLNHRLFFYINLDDKQYYEVAIMDYSGILSDKERDREEHYFAYPDMYNLDDYKFLVDEEVIEIQFYE